MNDKIEELKKAREELSVQFKAVSADLLKTQTADFKKEQQESLGQILTPLKDQLDTFKKRMEEINQINATDKGKMDEQLKNLLEMNQNLSEDAKNLTNALKGNTKHQGDWGETQLERVFEVAGFENGINDFFEEVLKEEYLNLPTVEKEELRRSIAMNLKISFTDGRVIIEMKER